jgi:hypothetical protein
MQTNQKHFLGSSVWEKKTQRIAAGKAFLTGWSPGPHAPRNLESIYLSIYQALTEGRKSPKFTPLTPIFFFSSRFYKVTQYGRTG